MRSRRVVRAVAWVVAAVVGVVGLPVLGADASPAVARSAGAGSALSAVARRGAFLAAQGDDGAAMAAAEEMGAEVSAEATGAGDGGEEVGPVPEGANPLVPEPGESVLPEPVEQEGSVEPVTIESRGPPDDAEGGELAAADEVVAKRTERSKTYANGDGSFTTETSMAPMHVEFRGGWEEIDLELREGLDGDFENGMAPVDVTVAESGSSDGLAVVGLGEGMSVAYGLEGAAAVEPDVEGAVAVYEEILPGVDLELESIPGGLKETAVLASIDAPSELTFRLGLEGLTAEVEETGGVALSDDSGVVVAAIPPGFMVDSGPDGGGVVRRGDLRVGGA